MDNLDRMVDGMKGHWETNPDCPNHSIWVPDNISYDDSDDDEEIEGYLGKEHWVDVNGSIGGLQIKVPENVTVDVADHVIDWSDEEAVIDYVERYRLKALDSINLWVSVHNPSEKEISEMNDTILEESTKIWIRIKKDCEGFELRDDSDVITFITYVVAIYGPWIFDRNPSMIQQVMDFACFGKNIVNNYEAIATEIRKEKRKQELLARVRKQNELLFGNGGSSGIRNVPSS